MPQVMFYEAFEEEEKEIKKIWPRHISAEFTAKTIQEHGSKEPPAEIISIRTQSQIPDGWADQLKGVLARSQGYDHLSAYRRRTGNSVPCGYLGNYCARAVAEQAILMVMTLLRKWKEQIKSFRAFSRDGLTGTECRGRKALVVGVGNIGKEIVDIAQGLRMDVKGVDIAPKLKGIEYVSLQEGLAWAEIVFCALPLTDQTEGMFHCKVFNGTPSGLIFINIARGEIAPVEDLKKLFHDGVIGGIGLDVYEDEQGLADALRAKRTVRSPQGNITLELAENDRVVCTPHNAFNTQEALKRKVSLTVEDLMAYLEGKKFPHPVP